MNYSAMFHIEKKNRNIADERYRQILSDNFGVMSSTGLKPSEQPRFLELLKAEKGDWTQDQVIENMLKQRGLVDAYADTIAKKRQKVDKWRWADGQTKATIIAALRRVQRKAARALPKEPA